MNPDDYSEMICSGCTSKLSFLPAYTNLIGKNIFNFIDTLATMAYYMIIIYFKYIYIILTIYNRKEKI